MIPPQLHNDRIKFCKVRKGTKKPFEKDWTNKPYSYQEIEDYLKNENEQYGVLCGYGDLAVIDADNQAFQIAVENMFPKTFRVKTGSGGVHNYFFIPDLKQKIILKLDDESETHLGEVQSYGTQVVGAGSLHPNGNTYELLEDIEIATVTGEELYSCLKPFMKKEIDKSEVNAVFERQQTSEIDDLSVMDIWSAIGLKKMGDEYYGCHPLHGSSGGMNFWINPRKNTWHCFRCNSGGGVLSAIGVKEGIIDCSEAQKGSLRGDNAKKCIELAKEKYGLNYLKDKDGFYKDVLTNIPKTDEGIKIIWEHELPGYEAEEKEWIVDKLIPTKSVCILTGKRGTLKTFVALTMAYSITSGNDFLNKYPVTRGTVLYLDKENGIGVMKQRTKMIKKGMSIDDDKNLPIGFICFSTLKIDKTIDISLLEEKINTFKPKLLIVDTYRRAISFDENDAGEVSKLFVDILRPLVEKHNISILLIHHNRKSSGEAGDEMDELRGSSDLANYSDIILKMERNSSSLVLKQLKNRSAQEEQPIKISHEFEENCVKLWYEGEYFKKNRAEAFMEDIIIWASENGIKTFETKQIKNLALDKGVKKNCMFNALIELQDRNLITSISSGKYQFNKV
jgi:hypothetical protein